MLICDSTSGFMPFLNKKSSGRKKGIREDEKIGKYSQNNIYVRIVNNSFVCVCLF